jgi:hypothetical protein
MCTFLWCAHAKTTRERKTEQHANQHSAILSALQATREESASVDSRSMTLLVHLARVAICDAVRVAIADAS